MKKSVLLICITVFLAACAGPSVTRTQALSETADAPYSNVLVVTLFESFDIRRVFEEEIVKQLKDKGIEAVRSTSMMTTKTPVNRETILAIVDKTGSDAVLVTQLLNLETSSKVREANPEATYNVRPTYYYNVWNVELTEYEAPPGLELKSKFTMATEVFSVSTVSSVWAIETSSKINRDINQQTSGTSNEAEAKGIVSAMLHDGLLAR